MKRQILLKFFIFIMALSLFTACGQAFSNGEFNVVESADSEFTYLAEKVDFVNKDAVSDACLLGDRLYIATSNEEKMKSNLWAIDLETRKATPVHSYFAQNEKSIISRLTADSAGNLVVLEKCFEGEMSEVTEDMLDDTNAAYRIRIWNPAQESVVSELDITPILKKQVAEFVSGFEIDAQGNYYLAIGKSILVLSPEGKELFEVNPNLDWFVNTGVTGSGQVAFLSYSSAEKELSLSFIDGDAKQVSGIYSGIPGGNGSGRIAGDERGLYLSLNEKVYLCDIEKNTLTEQFRWYESRINDSDVKFFAPYGEEQFIAVISDQMGSGYETQIAYFSKVPRSEVPTQKVLVLATFVTTRELQDAVADYNSSQDDCLVEIKDYCPGNAAYEEQKELYRQMLLDITMGDGIDLFTTDFDCNQLVAAGLVENLYPYLEADPELKDVEFFQSVLDNNSVGEVLTNIPAFFHIEALIGREADFGNVDDGLSMEEVRAVMTQQPQGRKLGIEQTDLLRNLIFSGFDKFVDWESGECNFESEEFISILEFAKEYGTLQSELDMSMGMEQDVLLQMNFVFNGLYYSVADGMLGEAAVYKGNPVWSKEETNGNDLISNLGFHICSTSENKEEAWQFARSFLLSEYYEKSIEETGVEYISFPARRDIYEQMFEEWMATETITNNDGSEEIVSKYSYYVNGEEIREPITTEDKVAVTKLIENAGLGGVWNPDIWSIIEEEAAPFFEGQKRAQDVAQIIQSRVRLYVSESIG